MGLSQGNCTGNGRLSETLSECEDSLSGVPTMAESDLSATHRDLVYILAPSYTGSTLLTFLLAQCPEIATVGELKATSRGDLNEYCCSCGQLQRACEFWQQVATEMHKCDPTFTLEDFGTHFRADPYVCDRVLRAGVRGRAFEATRALMLNYWPGCRTRFDAIGRRNRQLIEVLCGLQGGEIFLDGSKDPNRLKFLIASGYWDIKAIYLIRDGRGATSSYMRHYGVSMDIAAREWRRVHQECDRVVENLDRGKYMEVRYEELCTKPEQTLGAIYAFLGLGKAGSETAWQSSENHIMGNQMRFNSTSEIVLDEKWRNTLRQQDFVTFDAIAGDLNQAYGYDHNQSKA